MNTTLELNPNLTLARVGSFSNLDPDADLAACELLSSMSSGDATLPERAFRVLLDRNQKLKEQPKEEIRDCLTRQVVLLEALWMFYAKKALETGRVEHSHLYNKSAMACQRALNQTLGAINLMHEEERNAQALDA